MTVLLPKPPIDLDEKTTEYLRELTQYLEQVLNDISNNYQRKGDPVVLPRVTVADITANPGRFRAGQEGRMVLVTDAQNGGGSVGVSHDDSSGALGPLWHELNLGAEVST